MALTKAAKQQLGATIVGHDKVAGIKTITGLIKTSQGLIAPQSTDAAGMRSGGFEEPQEDTASEETGSTEEVVRSTDSPEPSVQVPATNKSDNGLKKSKRRIKSNELPLITTKVEVPEFGSIPTQYTHMYIGNDVLVLGLHALSFVPKLLVMTPNGPLNPIKFSTIPDKEYVYVGNNFEDNNGITNLILVEIKKGL